MIPPKLSANRGDKNCKETRPIPIAAINANAEQLAITNIDLNGMRIFLNPYVKPTLKLSRLTANASIRREIRCIIE